MKKIAFVLLSCVFLTGCETIACLGCLGLLGTAGLTGASVAAKNEYNRTHKPKETDDYKYMSQDEKNTCKNTCDYQYQRCEEAMMTLEGTQGYYAENCEKHFYCYRNCGSFR